MIDVSGPMGMGVMYYAIANRIWDRLPESHTDILSIEEVDAEVRASIDYTAQVPLTGEKCLTFMRETEARAWKRVVQRVRDVEDTE